MGMSERINRERETTRETKEKKGKWRGRKKESKTLW